MRSILKWSASIALVAAVATPGTGMAQDEDGATIGISIPAATHGWTGGLNYHTKRTVEAMEAAFPNLEFVITTANDVTRQANDIEDMVTARNIDALVVLPFESEPITVPVSQAKAAGVFITVVDRGLSEEGIEDLYVGGNNPQYGIIAAQYFKDKFPDGAKIVVMRGIPTTIDNIRIDAFQKELEGSNIEILAMEFANWNPDKGFTVMQDFLSRFPEIDGVWAGDDDAALGAIEAVKQASRDEPIAILGGSGMNRVIKMIMDGDEHVDADIFYPPTIIIPAIELTAMHFATQAPVRGNYILDSPLITKDNAAEFYFPDAPY